MVETHTVVRPTRWFWIATIWSVCGLFDASQTVLIMHSEGRHHPWLPLFGTEPAGWLPWALATPLIVGLARRYPFVDTFSTTLLYQCLVFIIAYALILTVTYLVDARERITHQASETARLNEEISRAQLAALRRQALSQRTSGSFGRTFGLSPSERELVVDDGNESSVASLTQYLAPV